MIDESNEREDNICILSQTTDHDEKKMVCMTLCCWSWNFKREWGRMCVRWISRWVLWRHQSQPVGDKRGSPIWLAPLPTSWRIPAGSCRNAPRHSWPSSILHIRRKIAVCVVPQSRVFPNRHLWTETEEGKLWLGYDFCQGLKPCISCITNDAFEGIDWWRVTVSNILLFRNILA